jgi:hypothetical protein
LKFPATPTFGEIQPIEDGYLVLTQKGIFDFFAQDLTPEEKALVLAAQGATQSAILSTPIKQAAWHSKPNWFVIASNDQATSPEQEVSTADGRQDVDASLQPPSHAFPPARSRRLRDRGRNFTRRKSGGRALSPKAPFGRELWGARHYRAFLR